MAKGDLDIPGFGKYGPHPIMAKIYNNEAFRDAFIDWYIDHTNHEFHPDSLNWNASDHAEGLYFFAMEIDGFYDVRPLGKLIVKPYKSIATPAIETLCV